MREVRKRTPRPLNHGPALLTALLAVSLALLLAGYGLVNREEAAPITRQAEGGVLYRYEPGQVARLRVTVNGEAWEAEQTGEGVLTVTGEDGFQVADSRAKELLQAAAAVTYERVLMENAANDRAGLEDFGLATPRLIAEITYADGVRVTLRVGAKADTGLRYMLVDGDERLFALDQGTFEALSQTRAELHPVSQPVLHKARMDRVTLWGPEGSVQAEWVLQGDIGGNAVDRWLLTQPLLYPADGGSMDTLLSNVANLRLGAYVAPATPENLAAYGFDQPRWRIAVHMAAGTIGSTDAQGAYAATDWPESVFTLTVGAARDQDVDYVLVNDVICISSHYSLSTLMDMPPENTLTRYAVPTALGNLKRLTVRTAEGETVFTLAREERVKENNELETDGQGNVRYDVTCQRDGTDFSYEAFAAAYNDLLMVRVSGRLPAKWKEQASDPHTIYTFEEWDGTTHTLALAQFDARHDAVCLDGSAVFYLIQGGMALDEAVMP